MKTNKQSAIDIAKHYFMYSNEGDVEAIGNLLLENATYSSDNTGMHFGKENILNMTSNFLEKFKELHWEVIFVKEESPGVIFFKFTLTGKKFDGSSLNRNGEEYVIVHGDKIQHVEVRNKD